MLEMIFLMIAAAASGGDGASGTSPQGAAALPVFPAPATQSETAAISTPGVAADGATDTATETGAATTAFLAPSKDADSATASTGVAPATAFLAPKNDPPSAPAATAFLAPPAKQKTAPAPVFLAPKTQQPQAAPAFLAPKTSPGLVAEPQIPTGRFTTAIEVKPILNATRANWISVREFDGKDLLYVTHLWAWRCGLLELRVGINGNPPEIWPLPPCHLDQPSPAAILEGDGLPYAEFGLGALALIEVQITYDDLSTDSAKFNRKGMLVP